MVGWLHGKLDWGRGGGDFLFSSRPFMVMSAGMNYDDARQQGIVGMTTEQSQYACPDLASGNRSLVRVRWLPYMKSTQKGGGAEEIDQIC